VTVKQSETSLGKKSKQNPQSTDSSTSPSSSVAPSSVSTSTSLVKLPPKKPPHWIQKAILVAIVSTVSATLGLTAALLLPLPMGLLAKDQGAGRSLNLWQIGLGYRVGRPVNILIMGIDRVPEAKENTKEIFSGRSDTMLLLRVDPENDSVSLMSIPRDTQVEIAGIGLTKINDANVRGGATLSARTVSTVLNDVPIDRYVRVSTESFRELVDLIGGVEINVPKPMVYEDKTQKLKINLSPGLQTLNGSQAEQFARFRYDELGDIGRVQRQQALLKALRKKATSPDIIPRIPSLVQSMQKYIDTNLSLEEMMALVGAGRKLSEGNFKMVMLPGRFSTPEEFSASYWIMDTAGRDRVMKQYFGIDPTLATTDESTRSANTIQIAIQNASHQQNAGEQMRQYLVKQGFNNVYVTADWTDLQTQTKVIAQRGDLNIAQDVQKILGLGSVEADSTGDLDSDLTIRIGDDWLSRKLN
jgi:polyisoprenyl-teichoic acid--peptidoglycan teichoic acid transferase